MTDRDYEMLMRRIASLLDLDLSSYKPVQMRRRLGAFIERSGFDSATAFVGRLPKDREL